MRSGAFEGIHHLLPAGSADEVLQTGSIHEAKLPSCQAFIVYFKYLNCTFIWVVEIRNTSEAVFRPQYAPWASYLPRPFGPWSVLCLLCVSYIIPISR